MSQLRNRLFARSLFFAVVLLGGYAWLMAGVPFVVNQNAAATGEQGFAELKLNKPVRGELPVGASHRFQITLEAGTFVFFEVVSTGQAAEFELYNSKGELVYRQIRWARETPRGLRRYLNRVVEISDTYHLELRATPNQQSAIPYELTMLEMRPATDVDRTLQQAEAQQFEVGRLWQQEQKFDEAIALGEPVLATYLKLLPPDASDIGNLAIGLINSYTGRGYHRDISRRRELAEIALRNREAMLGRNSYQVAILYEWLAELSDPGQAEKCYQQAWEIVSQLKGPKHFLGAIVGSWANVVWVTGDHVRAEKMYEQSVQMIEEEKGPEEPLLTASLINYGQVLMDRQKWSEAEICFQRVLSIVEKHPEGSHMEGDPVGLALYSLAELSHRKKEFAQAEAYQQKLFQYRQKNSLPHQTVWATYFQQKGNHAIDRGRYEEASRQFEQAQKVLEMTGDSPEFANLLYDWRKLYLLMGRTNDAIAAQRRAVEISEIELKRLLAYGSEKDKMKVLSLVANEITATLSLHIQSAPDSDEARDLAFTTLLRRKGHVMDEMNRTIASLRLSANGQDADLVEQWINKASQISVLLSRTAENEGPASQLTKIDKLNQEFEQLQETISQRNAEFRAQVMPVVKLEDVREALPPGSALIEFAQYEPEDPRTNRKSPAHYLAYVLPKEGTLRGIDLGEVAKIDAAALSLRQAISDKEFRTNPRPFARKLDELVMRPIRPLLGQAKTIFVAPEGELNLVPFAALRDTSGKYLIENYLFVYLTSGRDLLRLQVKHQSQPDKLIFAVNDFDGQPASAPSSVQANSVDQTISASSDSRSGRLSDDTTMATLHFSRLDHAGEEGKAVQRIVPGAKLFLDAQAQETTLKQVHRPYFLHLATHGFFLPDAQKNSENPLLRSGLALAGANVRQSGKDDGVLTAFEAAALDLWGTKLVVLSACNTGNGQVKNGEGVFGLRRALVLAGAETQVSSLWRANDEATQKLMLSFYSNLKAKMGRAEALRQAQLKMLRDGVFPKPHYWANFICIGDWRPLQ